MSYGTCVHINSTWIENNFLQKTGDLHVVRDQTTVEGEKAICYVHVGENFSFALQTHQKSSSKYRLIRISRQKVTGIRNSFRTGKSPRSFLAEQPRVVPGLFGYAAVHEPSISHTLLAPPAGCLDLHLNRGHLRHPPAHALLELLGEVHFRGATKERRRYWYESNDPE